MTQFRAILIALLLLSALHVHAQSSSLPAPTMERVCPRPAIQEVRGGLPPGGAILTQFDRRALWVYDARLGRRYPLVDTLPCTRGCRLSPDLRFVAYFNDATNAFNKMWLNGGARQLLVVNAAAVEWWSADTLLVWTPGRGAYLRPEARDEREYLDVTSVVSVQPGGRLAVYLEAADGGFNRTLIDLTTRAQIAQLGADRAYFNAHRWSPDGSMLAYVAPIELGDDRLSSEIFTLSHTDPTPTQRTNLTVRYHAVRINGLTVGELSWSPDGSQIAFWVIPLTDGDPEQPRAGIIHVLDLTRNMLRAYCAVTTTDHTPNPSRLAWSPDGTYLAFAADLPNDAGGRRLLALNVETGVVSAISDSVASVYGAYDVIGWGLLP